MSARNELLSALETLLSPAQFVVGRSIDVPDLIDPGKLAVRALTKSVEPAPQINAFRYTIDLWVLSGKADPATVDDALDAGLDPMLEALLTIKSVQFVSAARGVMDDTWHGYLFTLNLYATGA